MKHKRLLAAIAIISALGALTAGTLPAGASDGPMEFEPIAGSAYGQGSTSWTQPFVIPDGFSQQLVSDETTLDIYPGGVDDLTDMSTTNETGRKAGRYLYRTHEVGSNGAVSIVDLRTGATRVLLQNPGYRRLDGIRWTPWGTLLFAEETTGGRVFEAFFAPADPTIVVRVEERRALGIVAHEGIEATADGRVFVIDELNGGAIYMFVPDRPRDLSAGQLYAIKATNPDGTGSFEWVALDRSAVQLDARAEADAKGASDYLRPEDVELIGRNLYVATTTDSRVLEIDLDEQVVSTYVQAGLNVPIENAPAGITGFRNPDNLAEGPDGRLWIVEDNSYSDIWVVTGNRPDDENDDDSDNDESDDDRRNTINRAAESVELFASLKDVGAEGTGIYFGKDPRTLFVNIQHADKPLADGTWIITSR
jgi:uncharacterized protein